MKKQFLKSLALGVAVSLVSVGVLAGLSRLGDALTSENKDDVVTTCCSNMKQVSIPRVAPTCENTGLTEGIICENCGKVYNAQMSIPALGHSDNDADYFCDICEEGMTTVFVEVPIEDGCSYLANRWVRVYRSSYVFPDGSSRKDKLWFMSCDYIDVTDEGVFYFSSQTDGNKSVTLSGIPIVETENYVDFYFLEGATLLIEGTDGFSTTKTVGPATQLDCVNDPVGIYFLEPTVVE